MMRFDFSLFESLSFFPSSSSFLLSFFLGDRYSFSCVVFVFSVVVVVVVVVLSCIQLQFLSLLVLFCLIVSHSVCRRIILIDKCPRENISKWNCRFQCNGVINLNRRKRTTCSFLFFFCSILFRSTRKIKMK
jgi:hypothetical protein